MSSKISRHIVTLITNIYKQFVCYVYRINIPVGPSMYTNNQSVIEEQAEIKQSSKNIDSEKP